jgi:hypothetical protein
MPDESDAISLLNAGSSSLKLSFSWGAATVCKAALDRLAFTQFEGSRAVVRVTEGPSLFDGACS